MQKGWEEDKEENQKESIDKILEYNWVRVVEDWGDEKKHEQFISKCREHKRLDYAVKRYLERKEDEVALKRIQQIQLLLEYELKAMLKGERLEPKKINYVAWFLFFLIASAILWTILSNLFK